MNLSHWYKELLSKINGSQFDNQLTPDLFEVTVRDGDKELAKWDLTEELRHNAMIWKNYTNASLNVNIELFFMHKQIKEKFKDEESFQQILEMAMNRTSDWNATTAVDYSSPYLQETVAYFSTSGIVAIIVGLIGLMVKLRASSGLTRVVKVTRIAYSVWCIIMGVLIVVDACMRLYDVSTKPEGSAQMILIAIEITTLTLMKTLVMSLKTFSVIVYIFQNIMLYRPFMFREHKKALSKWFLGLSLFQSVALFISFMIWSMILVMHDYDNADCREIYDRAKVWQIALLSVTAVGYIGSCILSLIFIIGYSWKNSKNLGQSETKNIKKTMIACLLEILFDFAIPIARLVLPIRCFKTELALFHYVADQLAIQSHCGILVRVESLDSGLSLCGTSLLIWQPIVQELFFLIYELIEHCTAQRSS